MYYIDTMSVPVAAAVSGFRRGAKVEYNMYDCKISQEDSECWVTKIWRLQWWGKLHDGVIQ